MLKAIIFDFDGILVDTEPFHYQAFLKTMHPEGFSFDWPEYKAKYLGLDDRDVVRQMFTDNQRELTRDKQAELVVKKATIFEELIGCSDIEPYPGVINLLRAFCDKLPIALCSGSVPSDIYPVLERLNLKTCFNTIVTAHDVAQSKPDPASYNLALKRLSELFPEKQISHRNAVAIEDSPAGIASATGAGIKVVAVSTNFPPERLSQATTVITSLADVSTSWFEQI